MVFVLMCSTSWGMDTYKVEGFTHYRNGHLICLKYNDREPICFHGSYTKTSLAKRLFIGENFKGNALGKGFHGFIDTRNPFVTRSVRLNYFRGYWVYVHERSPSQYIISFVEEEHSADIYVWYEHVSEPMAMFE